MKNARRSARRCHPQALTACRPLHFAQRRAGQPLRAGSATLAPFHQHHRGCERQDRNEEERVILDYRPDDCHFAAAGGQNLAFGQLVQPGDGELDHDNHQNDGGHLKKLLQVDTNRPAHEADAEQHCESDAENSAERLEDAGRVKPDHAIEHENGLDALAENHEEYKKEDTPTAAAGPGVILQTSFNFAF